MTTETNAPATHHAGKRLARLAAVQSLYQLVYEQETLDQVITAMSADRFAAMRDEVEADASEAPDRELFTDIMRGVVQHQADLDAMIAGTLDAKLSGDRMEHLLRAVLRAGTYELHHHGKIPAGVIINDYVDVTRAFFDGREPGLVNAVLDKIGQKLR